MSDVYGNEELVPEYRKCIECGKPMTMVIHMINSANPEIRRNAHKFLAAQPSEAAGVRPHPLRKFTNSFDKVIPETELRVQIIACIEAAMQKETQPLTPNAGKALENLFKKICPYCAGPSEYVELHDGRYHTKKGVNPSYENVKCYAADLRALAASTPAGPSCKHCGGTGMEPEIIHVGRAAKEAGGDK